MLQKSVAVHFNVNGATIAMIPKVPPPLSPLARTVAPGLYEHYKGLSYKVLGIARHSETLEELVVYQALYGEGAIWVRPLDMFVEDVIVEGKAQPRFRPLF